MLEMTIPKSRARNLAARAEVWRNLVLIEARSADEAFKKATKIGKAESGDSRGTLRLNNKAARTYFVGIADMGLVYDELGDGAEIIWQLIKCSQKKARAMALPKKQILMRLKNDLRH